jgi:enoyl-CoA hydratase/carnithine racemase
VSDDVVLIEHREEVAVLTFNRPERLNAWTPELQTRYFDLLDKCAADSAVRAIVLTGAGRGFCAGADMDRLGALSSGQAGGQSDAAGDPRPVSYALSIPKPLIAAINGAAAGLGLVHALMCDVRIADASAKLTTAFSRRGLIAEHGISWILPRLVGPARALDLLLSGRVVLGSEAAELGLVNRAVDDGRAFEEALAYAHMLAAECSPGSMAAIKRQVYSDLERGLAGSLEEANHLMVQSFSGPDFAEGVRSFIERRPPHFSPLAHPPAGRAAKMAT